MHRIVLLLFLCLAGLLSGCSNTIDTRYSFDAERDYSILRTYAWLPDPRKQFRNPAYEEHFQRVVDASLTAKGLQVTSNNPDFLIRTYATTAYKETYYTIQGDVVDFSKARLRFDFVDPKSKKSIWEGVATASVDEGDAPEKIRQTITQAVDKILKDFPPREKK